MIDAMTGVYCVVLDYGNTIDRRGPTDGEEYACFPVDPDAVVVMRDLRGAGLALMVASNTVPDRARDQALDAAGVGDLLIGVIQSHELGVHKPDPLFFTTIVDMSGYQPAEICYVGDRLELDILPALAVGMRAVLVASDGMAPSKLPQNVPLIRHVRDLPALFARSVDEARAMRDDGHCRDAGRRTEGGSRE